MHIHSKCPVFRTCVVTDGYHLAKWIIHQKVVAAELQAKISGLERGNRMLAHAASWKMRGSGDVAVSLNLRGVAAELRQGLGSWVKQRFD